jgi:hypothetical protein
MDRRKLAWQEAPVSWQAPERLARPQRDHRSRAWRALVLEQQALQARVALRQRKDRRWPVWAEPLVSQGPAWQALLRRMDRQQRAWPERELPEQQASQGRPALLRQMDRHWPVWQEPLVWQEPASQALLPRMDRQQRAWPERELALLVRPASVYPPQVQQMDRQQSVSLGPEWQAPPA